MYLLLTLSVALAVVAGCGDPPRAAPRVIILGIDGLDPALLGRFLAEGKLKSFSRLAQQGGFKPLGTSMPPQSPVAWSDFTTGLDSGGHGIFDFLRHDHRTFAVAESTSTRREPFQLFGFPLWGGGVENLRQAPDLIVGYSRGYRASWGTPLGKLGPAALEDNLDAWSGDHMVAADQVPGVLLANRPIRRANPALKDLPVTILDIFSLPRPPELTGASIFKE